MSATTIMQKMVLKVNFSLLFSSLLPPIAVTIKLSQLNSCRCKIKRSPLSASNVHSFSFLPQLISSIEIAGFDMKPEQWCTSWWHQFKVLLQRGLRERRYEAFNRLRIFQVLSVAVLGGLLWWHTPTSHIEDRVRISPSLSIN